MRDAKRTRRKYFFFYASILETDHRNCQQFMHSAALGLVRKLKFKKVEFEELLKEVEDGCYVPQNLSG